MNPAMQPVWLWEHDLQGLFDGPGGVIQGGCEAQTTHNDILSPNLSPNRAPL
ncbi:hypothetical protein GCM10008941_02900 [Rhizomicrobium palustre]